MSPHSGDQASEEIKLPFTPRLMHNQQERIYSIYKYINLK